jgi:hypothetical protein
MFVLAVFAQPPPSVLLITCVITSVPEGDAVGPVCDKALGVVFAAAVVMACIARKKFIATASWSVTVPLTEGLILHNIFLLR